MGHALSENLVREQLLSASSSFHGARHRKVPSLHRIYGSFSLPGISILPSESQRDTARRLEKFGLNEDLVRGQDVLDLGCHVGSVLFELQKWSPGWCLGVEYDADKVRAANSVVKLCGLEKVRFKNLDIETLEPEDVGLPYSIVLCLAVEAHLHDRDRLWGLLSEVTEGTLFFEGNSTTRVRHIEQRARVHGFRDIEYLGNCDDDARASNNVRPMFVMRKG